MIKKRFTDMSYANTGNIEQVVWNFGDGSPTVVKNYPVDDNYVDHIYEQAGVYNVSLTAHGDDGVQETTVQPSTIIGGGITHPYVIFNGFFYDVDDALTYANFYIPDNLSVTNYNWTHEIYGDDWVVNATQNSPVTGFNFEQNSFSGLHRLTLELTLSNLTFVTFTEFMESRF